MRARGLMGGLGFAVLGLSNAASAAQPGERAWVAAVTTALRTYAYQDGMVYPVLASPGRITDLVLQPGERLVGSGPLAAGDTVRWIIGDTVSGTGGDQRVHVLVKPTALGLATNLIINTDRRTYHLDLRSVARGADPEVRWRYAEPAIVVVPAPPAAAPPVVVEPDLTRLNLAYRIKGPRVPWRPLRVFDDGRRTYVEFAPAIVLADLPPLFIPGPDGKASELVNYHVSGHRIVIDRILDRAELRLGQGRGERRVRLIREAGR